MRVLIISSEAVPFAKTGGLGDMVGALSVALSSQGHDVRLVLPRYYSIDRAQLAWRGGPLGVPLAGGESWCSVFESTLPESVVSVYFLDHERFFGRDGVYGNKQQNPFRDNLWRFAFLCRGAFQLCRFLSWIPDVIHAHDWPAALAPVYLQAVEGGGEFAQTGSVLTIHNVGYQGNFDKHEFPVIGLPWESFHGAGFESHDAVNLLQAGVRSADVLTAVSPTYAQEIQTPAYGFGLDGLFRHRAADLFGILNGMDYRAWNPERDPYIPAPYSHDNLTGKAAAKAALQETVGLPVNAEVPIIGMVTRLVDQKGIGALCGPAHGCLYPICNDMTVQVVILGTGDAWCEQELRRLAGRLPNLRGGLTFSEPLAHLVEAGSDFFLMPSQYEPCGLNQMYSLRYGTPPIVRRTGGLADTVETYDERTGEGTGFVFDDLTPAAIYNTVGWAVWAWYNRPEHILAMRRRGMLKRFSWQDSARSYAEIYQAAVDRRTGRAPRTW